MAANANSYAVPDQGRAWPMGLMHAELGEEELRAAFRRRLVVLLGEDDTDVHDTDLPQDDESLAQGPHRLARGKYFFEYARSLALKHGWQFSWKLQPMPAIGHSTYYMADHGSRLLGL